LKFLENGEDKGKGAPMACAMVYWGGEYERFYEVFIEYGAVVNITNLIGEDIGEDRKRNRKLLSLPFPPKSPSVIKPNLLKTRAKKEVNSR
jgi:hypothetical protein